jgi:lysylphosphatidylglycerol synthetase-like protein (DUF2156 family)
MRVGHLARGLFEAAVALVPNSRERSRCQTDFCALNVTASEPLPAQLVGALANASLRVSQSASVKNATAAAINVVMFAAVLAKLNGKLNLIRPKRRVKRSRGRNTASGVDSGVTTSQKSVTRVEE